MADDDHRDALNKAFLVEMFRFAEHSLFLTTLPNERGSHGARHERRCAAELGAIETNVARVIEKYDRDGQAIYFCASTIDSAKVESRRQRALEVDGKEPLSERAKETIGEIVALWIDIDLKNIKLGPAEIYRRLSSLRLLPSAVVNSGNGVHVWYFLNEALPATPEAVCELETLLGVMCFSLGGDKSCCEVARLMRLPGSHNTKHGAFKPVEVKREYSDLSRRYDFEELKEFWRDEPRVLQEDEIIVVTDARTGRTRRQADGDGPEDAFQAYVRSQIEAGNIRLPPLDVDKLLGSMIHGGAEHGVHNTMLAVTSSLVWRGWPQDEILDFVLQGVGAWVAAHGLPKGWPADWGPSIEGRARAQIAGAVRKASPEKLARARERRAVEVKRPQLALVAQEAVAEDLQAEPAAVASATGASSASANVLPFKIERRKPGRPRKDRPSGGPDHVRLARHTLERMLITGQRQICFWRGELWIYEDGLWRAYEGKDQSAWIETEIHATVRDINDVAAEQSAGEMREDIEAFDEDSKLRVETLRYIRTMPELRFSGQWDKHGLVPLANGLFDPASLQLTPYAPEHRATYRFAAPYEPGAAFTHGEQMIRDLFAPYGAEAEKYVWLVQQFCYVAIFKTGKFIGRQLRRCLYLQGGQNSGKSQLVKLLRLAVGSEYSSATTLDEMSDPAQRRFALEGLITKALWAADEAASEKTRIDAPRVKALLAEDPVKTDVKGKAAIERPFLAATIFSANSYPRTLDSASGFSDRFMLVKCTAQFDNENPVGVARVATDAGFSSPADFVAATEMAGFLNWAIGARDHIERQHAFAQPSAVVAAREEIADKANPVRAFIKECVVETSMDAASKTPDIYEAYREWHAEDHGTKQFCVSPKTFWAELNTYFNDRRGYAPRNIVRAHDSSLAVGIGLNESGKDYWNAASEKKAANDKSVHNALSSSEHTIGALMTPSQIEKAAHYFGITTQARGKARF